MHTVYTIRFASVVTIVSLILAMSAPIVSNAQATDGTAGNPNPDTQQQAPGDNGQNGDPNQNGQSGAGGLSGGEQAPPINGDGTNGTGGGTTTVNTGNAESSTDTTNTTNTNTVKTEPDWSQPEKLHGWAKWRYEMCRKYPEGHYKRPKKCPPPQVTTISADNDAAVDAAATTTAQTGDNSANGGDGSVVINTGDAMAFGNAINVANTNIINSNGMLLFLNLLFGGSTDLRNLDLSYFFGGGSASGCSLSGCGSILNINADNSATVTNSLVVRAQTGANDAMALGDATINSGNAYAAGNAVNLVNTNIIDSNYLLVTLNSFGNLGQDITLPGADFFQKLLALQSGGVGGNLNVNSTNNATVTDGTNATADSGVNSAGTVEGNTVVNSGNAISSATAINQVNSNLIGGTQIFLLFRVWGDWSGQIQGLPDGMVWEQTPFGIVLKNKDGSPASTSALRGGCGTCGTQETNVNATNTAALANNVNVFALTGENEAQSASGTAAVNSGNAFAAANSVNMVNTNLIGQNWIFMIFNIFGNWNGNISFGHPDLWIGASAETGNPTVPGSTVVYHFTVANRGDSDATNVRLRAKFPKVLTFTDGLMTEEGEIFNLGTIPRGSTKEFIFKAAVGNIPSGTSASVPMEATVSSAEVDNNIVDNTEHLDLVVQSPVAMFYSKTPTVGGYEPKITIVKTANVSATSTPAKVDYKIVVKNDGGDAFNGYLSDTLRGPDGRYIGDQEWSLGKIKSGEEITITYTVAFGKDIPEGKYTNTAVLHGQRSLAIAIDDVSTQNTIEIIAGEVLGAATIEPAKQCVPLLTEYLRVGARGSEVAKLQHFLSEHEGMEVPDNGIFDDMTQEALKEFQAKYAAEILTPWGLTTPTGSVYSTTRKKINELACDGAPGFNLSEAETNEINAFKAAPPAVQLDAIKKGNVGARRVNKPDVAVKAAERAMHTDAMQVIPEKAQNVLTKQLKQLSRWLISAH